MKANIIRINRYFDEVTFEYGYEILLDTEKEPELTLGECEITQKQKKNKIKK